MSRGRGAGPVRLYGMPSKDRIWLSPTGVDSSLRGPGLPFIALPRERTSRGAGVVLFAEPARTLKRADHPHRGDRRDGIAIPHLQTWWVLWAPSFHFFGEEAATVPKASRGGERAGWSSWPWDAGIGTIRFPYEGRAHDRLARYYALRRRLLRPVAVRLCLRGRWRRRRRARRWWRRGWVASPSGGRRGDGLLVEAASHATLLRHLQDPPRRARQERMGEAARRRAGPSPGAEWSTVCSPSTAGSALRSSPPSCPAGTRRRSVRVSRGSL